MASVAHIDDADLNVLALEQRQQLHRDFRVDALDRNLIDAARGQRRKCRLVLPPFIAERAFQSMLAWMP